MDKHANSWSERATAGRPSPRMAIANVRVLLGALDRLGYDAPRLQAIADLQPQELQDPDRQVPVGVYLAILQEAQRQRPNPNLALHLAAATPIGAYPIVDYLVVTSPTVGEGLQQQARYFRLSGVPISVVLASTEPTRVRIDSPYGAFGVEYVVSLTLLHTMKETDSRFRAEYVSFEHEPDPRARPELREALGCPILVGRRWSGFAVSRSMWALPLRRGDPALQQVLEQHAAEVLARLPAADDLVTMTRRILGWRMTRGHDLRIEAVARQLGMSQRSLQRHLGAMHRTYHALVEELRRETAIEYLSTRQVSIREIAFLLGYSDHANFARAFRRWTGQAPKNARQRAHSRDKS